MNFDITENKEARVPLKIQLTLGFQ